MSDLRDSLRRELVAAQRRWKTWDADTPELWFATLELESATIEGDMITFVLHDKVDGTRHGWRWEIAADRPYLLQVHLMEDLNETQPTEPDENGIQWWGVNRVEYS